MLDYTTTLYLWEHHPAGLYCQGWRLYGCREHPEYVHQSPGTSQPVTCQPGTSEPITGQPVTGHPVTGQSSPQPASPGTSQPGTGRPGTSQPCLRKFKYRFSRQELNQMYVSYVRPLLEYSSIVWDGFTEQDKTALERLQK